MQGKLPSTLIIFSSDRTDVDSLQNLKNQGYVAQALSDARVPFSIVDGTYDGVSEVGFCAYLPSNPDSLVYEECMAAVLELCIKYNQETYLQVSPEHTGRLVSVADGEIIKPLGRASFTDVQPANGDYTRFPSGSYLQVG